MENLVTSLDNLILISKIHLKIEIINEAETTYSI